MMYKLSLIEHLETSTCMFQKHDSFGWIECIYSSFGLAVLLWETHGKLMLHYSLFYSQVWRETQFSEPWVSDNVLCYMYMYACACSFVQCVILCGCVVYRNSVLANQNKGFKEQMKTLMDKGRHDDELIEALMVATLNILTWALNSFLVFKFHKF